MKKIFSAAVLAAVLATPAFAAGEASQNVQAAVDASAPALSLSTGKMLYANDGQRLGAIYRLSEKGNPIVILDGQLVVVPATTLTSVDGKLRTSLEKAELRRR